jgi:hypothetical protein
VRLKLLPVGSWKETKMPNSDQATDDDALKYKMERAIHGLRGIFWALSVFTDKSVDTLRSDWERENGIA